jgi:hypothetical protein
MIRQVLPRITCLDDEYKCTCWHHVTNHLIISNDKDFNFRKQKKIYASVTNNIWVKEGNKHKTAFKTNMGLYENTVMPFSLKNAPAVFQQFMNTEFVDLTATGKVIIYMDDILIATLDNITEH